MMWRKRIALVALSTMAVLDLLAARAVEAGPATDQLHGRVDRVLQILANPELAKESRTGERRAALRQVASEIFDFAEISRRSLGRHWQKRTPAEREEFVGLFGDLLERSYVSKIELYSGEKIEYVGEVPDGDVTAVRTRIITKHGTPIPVDYRMFQQTGQWRAYDALIEGVSLVGNYRSQFNSVVERHSYDDLVKMLRAKQQDTATKPAGKTLTPSAEGPSVAPLRREQSP